MVTCNILEWMVRMDKYYESPIKSIRVYCVEGCCEGQKKEVRLCPTKDCVFWLYRRGHRPNIVELMEWYRYHYDKVAIISEDKIRELINTPVKAIRKKCLNCSGWEYKEVRECTENDCPIHPYRMGKRPNRTDGHESNNQDKSEGKE